MPSRPNPTRPKLFINRTKTLFLILTISSSLVIFFAILYFIYHLWTSLLNRSRTIPFDVAASPLKLQLFSYKELKLATNDFDESNVIGKGGSGTVFRGITRDGKLFAVKRLDSLSLQTETEFQNELQILGGLKSSFLVTLLGYCVEKNHRFLIYEYMPNKSLQELLFNEDGDSCLNWEMRFSIILDVAKALDFMHFGCDPPVIHGDIKPSNVLLDSEFRAKISDFGLSRVKVEGGYGVDLFSQDLGKSQELSATFGGESTPQTAVGTPTHHEVDFALALQASSSSKNSRTSRNIKGMNLNPMSLAMEGETKGKEVSNDGDDSKVNHVVLSCEEDHHEFDQSKEMNLSPNSVLDLGKGSKQWGRDWWWKQEGSGELCSKDYVREWIGSQIDTVNPDWDDEKKIISSTPELGVSTRTIDKDESGLHESRFDTLQEKFAKEEINGKTKKKLKKKKKHRNMEEWWKEEEHQDERNNKKKIRILRIKFKNRLKVPHFRYCFHQKGENSVEDREGEAGGEFSFRKGWRRKSNSSSKKKKNNNNRSMGSEMWSGDLFSRELSSTTSMRGTLCYIAPEYGGGCCYLMEKGDIYSFGVLILVIISGRRPLHVLASPMKLEKANLVSWCRQLAQSGNVLELVDEKLKDGYNKEEAGLCINLALACLQKAPELRPDISEVVKILRGEMDISSIAFEFSPSPPAKFYGSRSKRRG
ncbi:PREDICTED: putative receptor-like protein kinase At1g80870 [Camelina sativa]|uniref:Receptor-like protein kinase At1g80870 n=1 Tax=Camelina sativa TaxID=90675 RepID=A0ABM0SXR1_CAMSA|nr:PREDICTED: putative receptor-like protein kinase At1g80870 [Camelina sativa]